MGIVRVLRYHRYLWAVAFLVILGLGSLWVYHYINSIIDELKPTVITYLKEQLGLKVTIGNIDFSLLGDVVLEGLRVAESQAPGAKTIFRAQKVAIKCGPTKLLREKKLIDSIKTVRIVNPYLWLERDARGCWNIIELFKRIKQMPKERFTGVLYLQSGKIRVEDKMLTARKYRVNQLEGLAVKADFRQAPFVNLEVKGKNKTGNFRDFRIKGKVNLDDFSYQLAVKGNRLMLGYCKNYLPPKIAEKAVSGAVDFNLSITGGEKLNYQGRLRVYDTALNLPVISSPVYDLNGEIGVVNGAVELKSLKGKVANGSFVVSGLVSDFKTPQLALQVTASQLDLTQITAMLDLPVKVARGNIKEVRAYVFGQASNPAVVGKLNMAEGKIYDADFERLIFDFRYFDRFTELFNVDIRLARGNIFGNALVFSTSLPGLYFKGKVQDLDLSLLKPYLESASLKRVGGIANGEIGVEWKDGKMVAISGLKIVKARWNDFTAQEVDVLFELRDDKIDVQHLTVKDNKGLFYVSGEVTLSGNTRLELTARDVDLAQFSNWLGDRAVSGFAYFNGDFSGSLDSPILAGDLAVLNGKVAGYEFISFQGKISTDFDDIKITAGDVEHRTGSYGVSGIINDLRSLPDARLDLEVEGRQVLLRELAELFNLKVDYRGIGDFRVAIKGGVEDFNVTGDVELASGVINGRLFEKAKAEIAYGGDELKIKDFSLYYGKVPVKGSGEINVKDKAVKANFEANDLDLKNLKVPQFPLGGRVDCRGELIGTVEAPILVMELSSEKAWLKKGIFEDIEGNIEWSQDRLYLSEVSFKYGEGRCEVHGELKPDERAMDLDVEIEGVRVSSLMWLIGDTFEDEIKDFKVIRKYSTSLDGALTATVSLKGDLKSPLGFAKFTLVDGIFEEYPLPDTRGDLAFEADRVVVKKLEAEKMVSVKGVVDGYRELALELNAEHLDIGLMQAFLGLRGELKGYVDLKAFMSGPLNSPAVAGSLVIESPEFAALKFEELQGAHFEIAQGNLKLEGFKLVKGEYQANFSGQLPFNWSPFGIPDSELIELQFQLKNGDLGIVPAFTHYVSEAEGALEVDLRVGGTLANLQLQGFIRSADGNLTILGNPIKGFSSTIYFEDSAVRVEEFRGYCGGEFTVGGDISLAHLSGKEFYKNQFALAVSATSCKFKLERIFEGFIDCALNIRSSDSLPSRPLIAGKIITYDSKFFMPPKEAFGKSKRELPDYPLLNIQLIVAKNVWFANPRLKANFEGEAQLGGNLKDVMLSGHFHSERGYMYYATSRFKLIKASAEFTYAYYLKQPNINLAVQAETKVQRHTIDLAISGPLHDLANLEVDLSSSPPLSEHEIYALLVHQENIERILKGRDVKVALREEFAYLFSAAVQMWMFEPFGRGLEEALGLEEVSIEYNLAEPVQLILGKKLGHNIYFSYIRRFTPMIEMESFRVEYTIGKRATLGWTIEENRRNYFNLEAELKF